jgi:tetratricopeptide (TPR) repeat protein
VNVVRAGRGAIASVIGEAGVGKTRLVAALEQELEGASCTSPWAPGATTDGLVRWGRARCLSFDTSVPYAPFVEFFRRLIGIEPADPPEIARARIETAIEHLPDTDPSLTTPYICALLGVDPGPKASGVIESMDAPELQRRTFAAILSWIQGCLSAGPGLLILEDLHWADSVSLSLVEELLRLTERAPLGVVFLMRPYKEDGSWGIHEAAVRHHEHRYTPIRLNPLDVDAQRALVRALLTDPEPQDQLVEAIVERSGGNPFFLEELVRLQLEGDGQASASLPDSVTGLLTARLDRLDPGTRLVAQFASVFGREFDLNDLSLLASGQVEVDRAVQDLLAGGIFEERERIPELELGFRHALTREAAYGSMLLKTRRDLHGRVAEHLIGRDGDAASIAQHLVAANEGPRAVPYLVTAGDQASRAMALSDAISLYSQAAAWLGDPPDVEMALRVHEGLGAAYGLIPDLSEVSATYQRLLEVGTVNDAPALQVTALNRLGFATATLGGSYDDATLYLEQAKALAERVQDHMGLAEYHMAACMIATARGDMEIAAAHDAQTAQLGEALGAGQLLAGGLIQRVMSLSAAVRLDEAAEALEHAKRATEGVEDPSALIGISMAEHFVLLGSGRLKESFDLAEKTSELARRVGSSQAAYATVQAGSVAALLGDYEASIAFFAEALRLAEESHQPYHAARAASGLVGRYAQVGRDDDYMDQMKAKAIAHLKAPMGTMTASSVYGELGWAALEAGRDEEAREWFETALAGSSSTRHFEEPSLRLGLALAQLHAGDKASAVNEVEAASRFLEEKPLPMFKPVRALVAAAVHGPDDPAGSLASLTEAAAMSESLGMRWLTWRIHGARALMLGRSGSPEAATEAISSAREVIGGIASDIVDDGLRSAFSEHSLSRLAGIASPTQ